MRNTKFYILAIVIFTFIGMAACSGGSMPNNTSLSPANSTGQIYLYGEQHGEEALMERELELWHNYYHNEGIRHLFVESSYYTSEYLNMWMKSDSDDILDTIYDDWVGTQSHVPAVKKFYKQIKSNYPETIFHGTDVGHQYSTTGERFLEYLKQNDLEDSEQYTLAQEAIEQGRYFYDNSDGVYRENKMTENFIREFNLLEDESVMGIYGGAHIGLDEMIYNGSVPCMANQLNDYYGNNVHSEDLSWIRPDIPPSRVEAIKIDKKSYDASYFGQEDLTGFKDYAYREFWRLENAYDDFKDNPTTGNVLPYMYYPMKIETGQVFIINHTKTDGTVSVMYYRSDGNEWNGTPTTEEFTLK